MRKIKALSLVLAVLLIVSAIPFAAAANEHPLVTAGKNGGTYTIASSEDYVANAVIEKDLTINVTVNGSFAPAPNDVGFIIKPGVTLTFKAEQNIGSFSFMPSTVFELQADAEKAAKLVIDAQVSGSVVFKSTADAQTKKPTIEIVGGIYTQGNLLEGIADLAIKGGVFNQDVSEYLPENYYLSNDYMGYEVIELSKEYSDIFKKNIDTDGKFIIKRYDPDLDDDYDLFNMDIESMFYLMLGDSEDYYYSFTNYDKEKKTALVQIRDNNTGKITEAHLVDIKFVYDEAIKKDSQEIIKTLPVIDDFEDTAKWYNATDLELVNYWLSGGTDATKFINFSGEFKKAFDYKNYFVYLDARMGGNMPLSTSIAGRGMITHNDTVYASANVGVNADHILYVPTETENSVTAKKSAVQKKLDDFLGKGKVVVKETTVKEAIYGSLWENLKKWILEEYPNATYEQFRNDELDGYSAWIPDPESPEYEMDMYYVSGLNDVTIETSCFVAEIGGVNRYFLVECNGEKIAEATPYQSTDIKTNVAVFSDDISVPLDTVVIADKLESGAEYERVIGALRVKDNATYDIKLYSESAQKYITKLENGKFQVKLPVPKELDGKELMVYYVDANGKIEAHDVTVKDGFAIFETDHFSTYVLSEARKISVDSPANNTEKSPATGNNSLVLMLLAVAFVSGIYSIKKIKA